MLFSPEDADKALQTANESPDNYFIIHRMNISSKLELTRHPTSDLHEWGSTGPAHCLLLFPSSSWKPSIYSFHLLPPLWQLPRPLKVATPQRLKSRLQSSWPSSPQDPTQHVAYDWGFLPGGSVDHLRLQSPIILAPKTSFVKGNFSKNWGLGRGMVSGWFKHITFIMHFILLLLH